MLHRFFRCFFFILLKFDFSYFYLDDEKLSYIPFGMRLIYAEIHRWMAHIFQWRKMFLILDFLFPFRFRKMCNHIGWLLSFISLLGFFSVKKERTVYKIYICLCVYVCSIHCQFSRCDPTCRFSIHLSHI